MEFYNLNTGFTTTTKVMEADTLDSKCILVVVVILASEEEDYPAVLATFHYRRVTDHQMQLEDVS